MADLPGKAIDHLPGATVQRDGIGPAPARDGSTGRGDVDADESSRSINQRPTAEAGLDLRGALDQVAISYLPFSFVLFKPIALLCRPAWTIVLVGPIVLGTLVGCTETKDAGTRFDRALQANARPEYTYDHGGIIRGPRDGRQLALVFTGGDYGEGTEVILDTLQRHNAKASFFLTGSFLRQPAHVFLVRRMIAEGHYVGPHSDAHPLYCAWENRSHTLVTRAAFRADLEKNLQHLGQFGLRRTQMRFFIPPYEWYNEDIARWSDEMGLVLVNFTPGTRSNADYLPDADPRFISSATIVQSILDYERRDAAGLNGFLLLLHLGTGPQHTDKMHVHVDGLMTTLQEKGRRFVRVDTMLAHSNE